MENFFAPTAEDQAAWDAKLADLAAVITSAAPDHSRINEGRPEPIDRILVSHALVGTLHEAQTIPIDDLPSIDAQPQLTPRIGGPPSDHRPAIARFATPA